MSKALNTKTYANVVATAAKPPLPPRQALPRQALVNLSKVAYHQAAGAQILAAFLGYFAEFISKYRSVLALCYKLQRNLLLPKFARYCNDLEWYGAKCRASIINQRKMNAESFKSIESLSQCLENAICLLSHIMETQKVFEDSLKSLQVCASETLFLAANENNAREIWNPWTSRAFTQIQCA